MTECKECEFIQRVRFSRSIISDKNKTLTNHLWLAFPWYVNIALSKYTLVYQRRGKVMKVIRFYHLIYSFLLFKTMAFIFIWYFSVAYEQFLVVSFGITLWLVVSSQLPCLITWPLLLLATYWSSIFITRAHPSKQPETCVIPWCRYLLIIFTAKQYSWRE